MKLYSTTHNPQKHDMDIHFNTKLSVFFILSCFFLSSCPCLALFSSTPHYFCLDITSNVSSSFIANRDKLLDSLSGNISIHNGFYTATWGENSALIYGLLQCRGDISEQNCSACADDIVKKSSKCETSTDSAYMLPVCFLRYSLKNFIGQSENSNTGATAVNVTEDVGVVSEANKFMRKLTSTAPKQSLMFQDGVLDVGQKGKRNGFVQCRRDLNASACGQCLNNLMDKYIPQFGDRRAWEFSSFSCSIGYEDVNRDFADRNFTNKISSTGK